jgi:predicted nucleic acid-binding protein
VKKLYLDVSTLCRPFDDQSAMRIRLETDAYYLILQNIQNGRYELVVSPVHLNEIGAIEDLHERLKVELLLEQYGVEANCDLIRARQRAQQLVALKFGVADAAHVAFAEATADCLISCDDKLLKRCRRHQVSLPAMNPVEFCMQEDLR